MCWCKRKEMGRSGKRRERIVWGRGGGAGKWRKSGRDGRGGEKNGKRKNTKWAGEAERESEGFLLWWLESDRVPTEWPVMTVPLENAGYASGVALMEPERGCSCLSRRGRYCETGRGSLTQSQDGRLDGREWGAEKDSHVRSADWLTWSETLSGSHLTPAFCSCSS